MMTLSDAEYGRKVKLYHKAYNRAKQRAFQELAKRHPDEFREILERHLELSKQEVNDETN
jgi:hypothetical protein